MARELNIGNSTSNDIKEILNTGEIELHRRANVWDKVMSLCKMRNTTLGGILWFGRKRNYIKLNCPIASLSGEGFDRTSPLKTFPPWRNWQTQRT